MDKYMDASLGEMDGGAFVQTVKEMFSFKAHLFEADLPVGSMLIYVLICMALCIAIQVVVYSKTYKKN